MGAAMSTAKKRAKASPATPAPSTAIVLARPEPPPPPPRYVVQIPDPPPRRPPPPPSRRRPQADADTRVDAFLGGLLGAFAGHAFGSMLGGGSPRATAPATPRSSFPFVRSAVDEEIERMAKALHEYCWAAETVTRAGRERCATWRELPESGREDARTTGKWRAPRAR